MAEGGEDAAEVEPRVALYLHEREHVSIVTDTARLL